MAKGCFCMQPEVQEWLAFAKMDMDTARHLYDTFYPKPLPIICYHCQQAAEKSIKAVIVFYGAEHGVPHVHDLEFLLRQIKNTVQIPDELWDYADALTPYGIEIRYPGGMEPNEEETHLGLKYAEALYSWAEAVLRKC